MSLSLFVEKKKWWSMWVCTVHRHRSQAMHKSIFIPHCLFLPLSILHIYASFKVWQEKCHISFQRRKQVTTLYMSLHLFGGSDHDLSWKHKDHTLLAFFSVNTPYLHWFPKMTRLLLHDFFQKLGKINEDDCVLSLRTWHQKPSVQIKSKPSYIY
jgi:hypothetical protein